MDDDRKLRILDLANEIARLSEEDVGLHARDIGVAARLISKLAEPSVLDDDLVPLSIYFAPDQPRGNIGDRVMLPDGRRIRGVTEVVVKDSVDGLREAKITVRGVSIFGAPMPEAR